VFVSDRINYQRILLNTPNGANVRWSDAQLIAMTDRAQKATVAAVYFPESRLTLTGGLANYQEYTLPEAHEIYRVYINGQIIARTPGDIDTLQGMQTLYNDQTAQGVPVFPGSGAPPGSGGVAQPQWTVQTPVAYPYLNAWGPPAPQAQPYAPGNSPRYYFRGGNLGIVPAIAAAGSSLVVEGVLVPTTITSPAQTMTVPDNFADAIDFYVCSRAWATDKDEVSQNMASGALANYDKEIRKLRTWKRQYSADDDQLMPLNYRAFYWFGQNRNGGGGFGN
jgi:hypothetical protein